MSDLYQAIAQFVGAAPVEEDGAEAPSRPIKISIVGRPNAGKSTLVNALLGEERVLTGPEAGITRDAITAPLTHGGRRFELIDTAGMRRKARVQGKLEQMSVADTIHAIRFGEVCALVMDQAEAFERQDLAIADLILREGRALVFVLAKWDEAADGVARFKELKERLESAMPSARGAPIVRVAALAGQGLDALLAAAVEAHRDWGARVKTADLNRWLAHAMEKHPPPAVRGRAIKPRYMTQIKARPPTFVLISSRADELPESYKRYLVNGVREAFDLGGAPIRLIVRQNKNPFAEDDG